MVNHKQKTMTNERRKNE